MNPKIDCYYSKGKTVGMMTLGVLMTTICGFCLILPALKAQIAGWAGLIFFGGATVAFLIRMFQTGPVVVISDAGLEDKRWGIGPIPWQEIASIEIQSMSTRGRRHEFIAIFLRDQKAYERKMSMPARIPSALNQMLGFSSFIVNCKGLDRDLSDIMYILERYHHASQSETV